MTQPSSLSGKLISQQPFKWSLRPQSLPRQSTHPTLPDPSSSRLAPLCVGPLSSSPGHGGSSSKSSSWHSGSLTSGSARELAHLLPAPSAAVRGSPAARGATPALRVPASAVGLHTSFHPEPVSVSYPFYMLNPQIISVLSAPLNNLITWHIICFSQSFHQGVLTTCPMPGPGFINSSQEVSSPLISMLEEKRAQRGEVT